MAGRSWFGGDVAGHRGSRLDVQGVSPAPFVERAKLAVEEGQLAPMLHPDRPVGGFGDPAEAPPVDDEPLVFAGRSRSLDLLAAIGVVPEPVDILGPEALCVVNVELAAVGSLGLLPIDLLAPRLDDVQVEVGVG